MGKWSVLRRDFKFLYDTEAFTLSARLMKTDVVPLSASLMFISVLLFKSLSALRLREADCYLKGQYHAIFSNTLKIEKTLFG